MKINLLLIILLGLPIYESFCQKVDYDKIILPESVYTEDFAEKLVRIAWSNYPQNEIIKRNVTVASHEVTQAKMQWLDIITIQGNLNEFTIKGSDDIPVFFPRYNFGASISLGMFGDIPAEIKKSKEKFKIAEAELNMQKLALRGEVLRRYYNYLLSKELMENQIKLTENTYSSFSIAEQRFKNGEITLQEYNISLEKYNQEVINQAKSDNEYNITKVNLEEILGVELESIQ